MDNEASIEVKLTQLEAREKNLGWFMRAVSVAYFVVLSWLAYSIHDVTARVRELDQQAAVRMTRAEVVELIQTHAPYIEDRSMLVRAVGSNTEAVTRNAKAIESSRESQTEVLIRLGVMESKLDRVMRHLEGSSQ